MAINPLKEFFRRKKAEVKFSRAGPGHKLSTDASGQTTSAKEAAAEAAMKRFSKQTSDKPAQRAKTVLSSSSSAATGQSTSSEIADQAVPDPSQGVKELPVIDGIPQRNVLIYTTEELAQRIKQPEIDNDFFRLTVEDAKLFKQRYEEEKARNEILKTSEMRKREAEARKPTTNIARIRFKLPNNKVLEASFSGKEKLNVVKEWLEQTSKQLAGLDLNAYDLLFGLKPFKDTDFTKSVKELNLIPATTLTIVMKTV